MRGLQRTCLFFCAGVLAAAGAAGAAVEKFDFSGTLQGVHDKAGLLGNVSKGTPFKGSYWFDKDKLREIQSSLAEKNSHAMKLFEGDENAFGLTLTIGEMVFTSGGRQNAQIASILSKGRESARIAGVASEGKQNAQIASISRGNHEWFTISTQAEVGNALQSVTLSFTGKDGLLGLETDPLLQKGAKLDDKNISAVLTFMHQEDARKGKSMDTHVTGDVRSHVPVGGGDGGTTPEPATVTLLALGAGMIFFRRTQKKRSAA
ncbi:MAG: PEP-CTERM sorting domain-containing protein [Phycisphaerae bacterium]|nr:PEP-CTERM sorting domain-containing protein [Phycisphaerae bacterium]